MQLAGVSIEGFTISSSAGPGGDLHVDLAGNCDSSALASLEDFLGRVHAAGAGGRVRQVTVRCENLYFMNSSAVKCFVTWLSRVKTLPAADRYSVTVRTNRALNWQSRCFSAISRSAPDVLRLDG